MGADASAIGGDTRVGYGCSVTTNQRGNRMADSVTVTNLPTPGSREAIALELARWAASRANAPVNTKEEMLNLYVDCLNAVLGQRPK